MKKRLITSALPYVNNIPHLGNLIQVLSADVFARFCRQYGYETLYICGTDEYGTATETKALEEGLTPQELCDRYFQVHADIYKWFRIEFDHFGRTSRPTQTEIVQRLFLKVDEAGFINERAIEQLFCEKDERFLADRYVFGECPHCGNADARGDQCENCGTLIEPVELVEPHCGICGNVPVLRKTKHLYLDLLRIRPRLEKWMKGIKKAGFWTNNAVRMTEGWIKDGLKERAITRDLKWGIPVPKDGFRDKVFYVWFDAPIGYISITADLTEDWERWWRSPQNTELFQFVGKDNIPFHTIVFPSTLIASGERWTMLHHMSSTEYLNYEDGKFSKSKGVGVFGNDCMDTGIPAEIWRFYIFFSRPENSDYQFTWLDFQEKVNGELIGNLGNFVNRILTFVWRFFDGKLPPGAVDETIWDEVKDFELRIGYKLNRAEIRGAFRDIFSLCDLGNRAFQTGAPWRTRSENPRKAELLLRTLCFLVRDLAILVKPYMPGVGRKIGHWLGLATDSWDILGNVEGEFEILEPSILFERLEDARIWDLRERFRGSQTGHDERIRGGAGGMEQAEGSRRKNIEDADGQDFENIDLRAATILTVNPHPNADKLYVISLDDGSGNSRTICSGLVDYYRPEELEGKTIMLVYNLKSVKLRGIMSEGMLLAVEDEKKNLEVLMPQATPGDRVFLEGSLETPPPSKKISINRFSQTTIHVEAGQLYVGNQKLLLAGRPLRTGKVLWGRVG
ncbi:Methionyl-tRNA synthetase [Olavius algarvensis spirochete endosymbiont]|uniref:methionine--tRNA ligase n=1 Tax=Olavius algarvensis spirochete endosymbiont TaxID=260710 RepID=UPI000F1EF5D7|nr:methionine--tRNA ligase [Olavius algarvensis spirochete endosymbiont]VDA99053.1 Methionyl-tRNA synthetase [Olavius algarvensis spirochete endosymbiont]